MKLLGEVPENLFVDMDPGVFSVLLNHTRTGILSIPKFVSIPQVRATASKLKLKQVLKDLSKDIVRLNVGGVYFETSTTTPVGSGEGVLAKMFMTNKTLMMPALEDSEGVLHIDACPKLFPCDPDLPSLGRGRSTWAT